jgi:hypothetical protein
MKKVKFVLVFLSLCAFTAVSSAVKASQPQDVTDDVSAFCSKYSKKEGFTVITLNKPVLKFASLMAKLGSGDDDTEFLSKIRKIHIISSDPGLKKDVIEAVRTDAVSFCNSSKYELGIEVNEVDEETKIFIQQANDKVTGFVIWNSTFDVSDVTVVFIEGDFNGSDMEKVMSKRSNSKKQKR